MALSLDSLPQLTQNGLYHWLTDKSGAHDAVTNPTGYGGGVNVELGQSALLAFVYYMTNPTMMLVPVGATIKYNASADDADETQFQFDYDEDGSHQFHMVRMPVSIDDENSIDTSIVEFVIGDIWYNSLELLVKTLTSEGIETLDITDQDDLNTIIASAAVTTTLCEKLYSNHLAVEKNNRYNSQVEARRNENMQQVDRLRKDQTDIQLGVSAASYQFSFGLKIEAQNKIESLLDQFVK